MLTFNMLKRFDLDNIVRKIDLEKIKTILVKNKIITHKNDLSLAESSMIYTNRLIFSILTPLTILTVLSFFTRHSYPPRQKEIIFYHFIICVFLQEVIMIRLSLNIPQPKQDFSFKQILNFKFLLYAIIASIVFIILLTDLKTLLRFLLFFIFTLMAEYFTKNIIFFSELLTAYYIFIIFSSFSSIFLDESSFFKFLVSMIIFQQMISKKNDVLNLMHTTETENCPNYNHIKLVSFLQICAVIYILLIYTIISLAPLFVATYYLLVLCFFWIGAHKK